MGDHGLSSVKVTLSEKLSQIQGHWAPHVVAEYNDNEVFVVKVQGEFPWHSHPETDDLFLVLSGEILLDVEDQTHRLGAGDLFVVPAGAQHRPRAEREAHLLLIEPKGTPNTGDPATAAPKPRI